MRNRARPIVVVVVLSTLLCADAIYADDQTPVSITCRDKTFPNLPGENAVVLQRDGADYTLTMQSYDKPKVYKKLTCRFHPQDARVFACKSSGSATGFTSEKTQATAIDYSGKETSFNGFVIEGARNPEGEPRTLFTLRFPSSACKL